MHIDDGTGDWSGGEGNIPHSTYMDFNYQRDSSHDYYDKYFDDPNYFATERHSIFHYCIFAHYTVNAATGASDRTGHSIGRREGTTDSYTYSTSSKFIIADARLSGNTEVAGTFMHELGHNLGLGFDDKNQDDPGSSMCYGYQLNTVDYSDKEWNELVLKFPTSGSGTRP